MGSRARGRSRDRERGRVRGRVEHRMEIGWEGDEKKRWKGANGREGVRGNCGGRVGGRGRAEG